MTFSPTITGSQCGILPSILAFVIVFSVDIPLLLLVNLTTVHK